MSAASFIAFGAVFVGISLGLSLFFSVALLLWGPFLRRMGPWVERRAATAALVLPPVLAFGLVAVLAVDSVRALSDGTDHCLDHAHHLHLCLMHGGAWGAHPWALCLVISSAIFVAVRFTLSAWAHLGAQRFAEMGFPLPPLSEQSQIVAEVERRLSVADEVEAQLNANLKRAARMRQAILKKAFEGRL